VEAASPNALKAEVLDERRRVIKNGFSQPTGQAGHFNILHSFDFIPMSDEKFHCASGDKEGLAAKDRLIVNQGGITFYIPS